MSADAPPGDIPLAILAKAPVPGLAKTRLIDALGPVGAARLHERLVRHTLEIALGATPAERITLWTALDHHHPFFRDLAGRYGITLLPQPEGELGERMYQALLAMPEPGLLIGTDCPVLTPDLLVRCYRALDEADVVMLPAEDGGYGLIGVRRPTPRLFDGIPWGTETVMAETRDRIASLGWRLACPDSIWDVDRPEDLTRLSSSHPALAGQG